jgi:hypothetical protein
MGGPYTVWVNGRLLHSNLDQWRMQWNIPLIVELPRDLSATRQPLDIELAVPYRTSQGYAVGSTYVGPLAAVQRMNDIRLVWQSSLPRAAILVALLLGLLALQFWFSLRSETGYLLLALTSVVWFVANTQYFGDFDDDLTSRWFGALNDAATSWLVPLITLFALRFEAKRWPRLELFLVVYARGERPSMRQRPARGIHASLAERRATTTKRRSRRRPASPRSAAARGRRLASSRSAAGCGG